MNRFILGLIPTLTFFLAGCATYEFGRNTGSYQAQSTSNYLIAANYQASDALIAIARSQLDSEKPIIVSTVVNIDDLERSSTLGRLISENVSARFTQSNYKMIEMKFQNAVYMKRNEGELMLTRQIRDIASSHRAQAVIVGTYSRAARTVFINLKLVRPESNIVIAAHDYALGINKDICNMIGGDVRQCAD